MKDLGSLWYFLGIEVAYSPKSYFLFQLKYITDVFKRVRLTDNKIVDTLIKFNTNYSFSDGLSLSNPTLYRIIIGSLIYLTITCPNIAYVVHVCCFSYYCSLGGCSSYFAISSRYSLSEFFTSIHLFCRASCILQYWSWQWSHRS